MNRTIYVRDEDEAIWDRAKELAGAKGLSQVIAEGLKTFVSQQEAKAAEAKGFFRIQLSFDDSADHYLPKRKAFHGRWVIPDYQPLKIEAEGIEKYCCYSVAITAKGNAVFFTWFSYYDETNDEFRFEVQPSLEAAAALPRLNIAARKAIEILGVQIEELDI